MTDLVANAWGSQREISTVNSQLATTQKRIIVCCDGTWDDALGATARWKYSNITRLARAIKHIDDRKGSPIHQVVFYQSGIGTEDLYDKVVNGTTGANLGAWLFWGGKNSEFWSTNRTANKVEEAYGFISQNYVPGDEIFLFGFSRGAYTARMVAMFIGAIGVLNRTQMDHFADIFLAYQKRGKAQDPEDVEKLDAQLAPWTSDHGPGKRRVAIGSQGFSIKVVGVFDTVGSVGLPEEFTLHNEKIKNIFGFPDHLLGAHIERAYHAMAINETRADFNVAKFEQTPEGRRKGQVLKQCWFTGSHSDIGGGYKEHDLMELTFNWMIANIEKALALDFDYIYSLPIPDKAWGTQPPHNPLVGIFSLAKSIQRTLPMQTNDITHEVIHPSVLEQSHMVPELRKVLGVNPSIVTVLLPWEEKVKTSWTVKYHNPGATNADANLAPQTKVHDGSLFHRAGEAMKQIKHGEHPKEHVKELFGRLVHESSIGPVVKESL